MTEHLTIDELLIAHAAAKLPEPVALIVATHLALSPKARARYARYEAIGGVLLDELEPAPLADDAWLRLQARLDEPRSRWKFDPGDVDDRGHWDDFQAAYEVLLERCSTPHAPWHVIPADRKWVRNALVAAIVRETLERMDPQYPEPAWTPGQYTVD